MASPPQNHFQQFFQQPSTQQQSKSFSDMYNSNVDGQISQQLPYFSTPNHLDHHPPYIPPFQVAGLAPGRAHDENGLESHWNFGLEADKKRPIEQSFLENNSNNNSQLSSLDLLRCRSVSTGLGLSLENPRLSSSGDSALIRLVGDCLDREVQRQDAEIDRFLKLQGDRLRQAILEKLQATQLQNISYIEERALQKLREKEADIEDINQKNSDLESRLQRLVLEVNAWQQRAIHNENTINALKHDLQQAYAQSRDSREGCGDSEVLDTASCCNAEPEEVRMRCKVCRVKQVCMLLLPCKHLCLCKECESKLSLCPLCESSKYIGMEVYM